MYGTRVLRVPARTAFDTALGANAELLALIEKLLALARAESGQGLPKEQLALDEIAFDVATQLRPEFSAKGLGLELNFPETPVYVTGDRTALELVVRNLLSNACKFTEVGGVRLEVSAEDDTAVLSVSDSGPGIPEASLPHLFERFYQVEVSHRRGGSGPRACPGEEYRRLARWGGAG